ncbi:MAG: HEAT repeat domain-containing protein [Candidatus Sumerlaeia bacterium]|nr:HEAT repeat domain-containing protein [Candidatus Sumerlaeia bacterium]
MSHADDHAFDHRFELLMELYGQGEAEGLQRQLLHEGARLYGPLMNYILRQPNEPRVAVLLTTLAKLDDQRAVPVLIRFLDIHLPELRRAAALSLGWLRAPAALEKLDSVEEKDPDETVRAEAAAAIDEILREYPNLSHVLRHHGTRESASTEEVSMSPGMPKATPHDAKLMKCVPRLVADKYQAVPIRYGADGKLHVAALLGRSSRLRDTLSEIAGHPVTLESWPLSRIRPAMQALYRLGDEDFCYWHDQITEAALGECASRVLARVEPDSPLCPLDEAVDAIEAVRAVLALAATGRTEVVVIETTGEGMRLRYDMGGMFHSLEPPAPELRPRFLKALFVLARIAPEVESGEGTIGSPESGLHFRIKVVSRGECQHRVELRCEH